MPASFVALPVGQGDAFLVSNTDFFALIDGGRSRPTLPAMLRKYLRGRALDVVACTHNDADHAEGLIGLLASRENAVGEVWLPGQWTTRLADLLAAPEAFMVEAMRGIDALDEDWHQDSLAGLADRYGDAEAVSSEGPLIAEVVDEAVEAGAGRPSRLLRHYASWPTIFSHHFHRIQSRLFCEAMEAAERIRQLAYLAWLRAVAVRWYDAATPPVGTTTGPLAPVNAKEIARVPPYKPDALLFLALSVSNKRSVCFEFRSTPQNPAVLFTADSDLNFAAPITWSQSMIVTAPHHGSEANAVAYNRAGRESPFAQSIVWVRSDGRFRSRPGATFLRQAQRYCTRCRPYCHGQQAARFTATTAGWIPKRTNSCRCV